jgi:hypothetical protein
MYAYIITTAAEVRLLDALYNGGRRRIGAESRAYHTPAVLCVNNTAVFRSENSSITPLKPLKTPNLISVITTKEAHHSQNAVLFPTMLLHSCSVTPALAESANPYSRLHLPSVKVRIAVNDFESPISSQHPPICIWRLQLLKPY